MLLAALASALLRTGFTVKSALAAEVAFALTLLVAGALHRRVRAQGPAQLAAIVALALAGAAVELVSGLPVGSVLAGASARTAVFLTCALLVRGAFARSSRAQRQRAWRFDALGILLSLVAGGGLAHAGYASEAGSCLLAAGAAFPIALARATAKGLKPLGIALAVLTAASAVVLSL